MYSKQNKVFVIKFYATQKKKMISPISVLHEKGEYQFKEYNNIKEFKIKMNTRSNNLRKIDLNSILQFCAFWRIKYITENIYYKIRQ